MNFENKLVKKPWGEEYLMYETPEIALWHLKIKQGYGTSLHAHPNKKTGLVNIKGGIRTSFLSDSFKLFPAEKIMIRQGVFHRSEAVVGDCEILEIETPNNKTDIVRLEDNYGRKGEPYEGEECYTEHKNSFNIDDQNVNEIGDCCVRQELINVNNIDLSDFTTYIVLKGKITSSNFVVCGPGDVLYRDNLYLMFEKFECSQDLLVLGIKQDV